ncbi:MAG: DNA recombination protein RmuC, partial [Prevotella pleuritidis]|nr:DNA recombination protein RmuC [Hoylesella pleuritidis]
MIVLYIIIGGVIGVLGTALILNGKRKSVEVQWLLAGQQLAQEQASVHTLQILLDAAEKERNELNEQLMQLKVEAERTHTQLEAEQQQNAREMQLRREQFEQQLKTVQEQFSNLATKVLYQASDQLKSSNTESMSSLTAPLKQNIEQLQQAIQHTNSETAKSTASLSQQLKEMSEQTQKIDATATRLTNVIRGGNKTQGNWGERMLTEILDLQGFRCGVDYDVQQVITDEKGNSIENDDSGKRMIPDVVL